MRSSKLIALGLVALTAVAVSTPNRVAALPAPPLSVQPWLCAVSHPNPRGGGSTVDSTVQFMNDPKAGTLPLVISMAPGDVGGATFTGLASQNAKRTDNSGTPGTSLSFAVMPGSGFNMPKSTTPNVHIKVKGKAQKSSFPDDCFTTTFRTSASQCSNYDIDCFEAAAYGAESICYASPTDSDGCYFYSYSAARYYGGLSDAAADAFARSQCGGSIVTTSFEYDTPTSTSGSAAQGNLMYSYDLTKKVPAGATLTQLYIQVSSTNEVGQCHLDNFVLNGGAQASKTMASAGCILAP